MIAITATLLALVLFATVRHDLFTALVFAIADQVATIVEIP